MKKIWIYGFIYWIIRIVLMMMKGREGRILVDYPEFLPRLIWVHTRALSVVLRVSRAIRAVVSPISFLVCVCMDAHVCLCVWCAWLRASYACTFEKEGIRLMSR
jgi:hypothetical protein